jgi:hypothetical protein
LRLAISTSLIALILIKSNLTIQGAVPTAHIRQRKEHRVREEGWGGKDEGKVEDEGEGKGKSKAKGRGRGRGKSKSKGKGKGEREGEYFTRNSQCSNSICQ